MACVSVPALYAQHTTTLQPDATTPHRTRLILKDGSYQIIMSYKVVGNVVHYISAERGGAEEEIPLSLVDLEATKRWDKQHSKPPTPKIPTTLSSLPRSIQNSSRKRLSAPPSRLKSQKISGSRKRIVLSLSTPTTARLSSFHWPRPTAT